MRLVSASFAVFVCLFAGPALSDEDVAVDNAKGIDKRVDYKSLVKYGPWDDRNYKLNSEDLEWLAPNEDELQDRTPLFFRVELRKHWPDMLREGPAQYPRTAWQIFKQLYGGYMRDGRVEGYTKLQLMELQRTWAEDRDAAVSALEKLDGWEQLGSKLREPIKELKELLLTNEGPVNAVTGAAESAVALNPAETGPYAGWAIAGVNGAFGSQEMYYSEDRGATWVAATDLSGNTCCDPTVDHSSDGTVAYTATLGDCDSAGCGIWFYRSIDGGKTWGGRVQLTTDGGDKEYLHVDHSEASPYKDYVYLTWHESNRMRFARSRDRGVTFDPVINFDASPVGIGSDITTTADGTIYYFWPGTASQAIWLARSTDGGATFAPVVKVADTEDGYDFALPAIDRRRAFIYVSCAADTNPDSPFFGSVYACWTDTTGPEQAYKYDNHGRVVFAYSRDGGDTWNTRIPHETADATTVDRFHPWLEVDAVGNVHVIFYDTRRDPSRLKTDVYYANSNDGGESFSAPERMTSAQSEKIEDDFEYGDYNGLDVDMDDVVGIWTDNRKPSAEDAAELNVFSGTVDNELSGPGFSLYSASLAPKLCVSQTSTGLSVSLKSQLEFAAPVSLTVQNPLPTGVSVVLESNSATPPATVPLTISAGPAALAGTYPITIRGDAAGVDDDTLTFTLTVQDGPPLPPTQLAPADGEPLAGRIVVPIDWAAVEGASAYQLQVSSRADFASLLVNTAATATEFDFAPPESGATYHWRIAAANACGQGAFSPGFSFTADTPPTKCESATPLANEFSVNGTTEGGTDDFLPDEAGACSSGYSETGLGPDVAYQYTVTSACNVMLELGPTSGADLALYVVRDCGAVDATCVGMSDLNGTGGIEVVSFDAEPGTPYFIIVDGYQNDSGSYTLSAAAPGCDVVAEGEAEVTPEGDGATEGEAFTCDDTIVLDPGFELESGTSPWIYTSSNFGAPNCSRTSCSSGQPRSGNRWLWFGGADGKAESASASQTLVFPQAAELELQFYLRVERAQVPFALSIAVDGDTRVAFSSGNARVTSNYRLYSADLSRYADGQSHVLTISATTDPGQTGQNTNLWVDDLCLATTGTFVPNAQAAALLAVFQQADTSGNGSLNPAEAQAAVSAVNAGVYQPMDTNGDFELTVAELLAAAGPGILHHADVNGDKRIVLAELLRVIQLYNAAQGYDCASSASATEDGYRVAAVKGAPIHKCFPHAADYEAPADFRLSLGELLRMVQVFNTNSYTYCQGASEDNFCLAP